MPKEKLAVIIPTKDRPNDLRRLLTDIARQETKPIQIIIVDGGAVTVGSVKDEFPSLRLVHIRKFPPSLTAQRNAGIRALDKEATLVAFFDDDVALDGSSLAGMMRFWETAPDDVGGAGFNLTNEIYRKPSLFEKVFFVNDDVPSRVLRSGFQSKVSCVAETLRAGWLPGCAMVWRRRVFHEFLFDENFSGYARYEEVDFSYRVGRKYALFIVAGARAEHLSRPEDVNFSASLGRMEVVNRLYFVKKNKDLSVAMCMWGLFGSFMNNSLKGVCGLDRRYALRALGNIAGLAATVFNHSKRA